RATDIDVFNGHGVRHIRSGRSFLERIQVGHYQIDWIDGQLLQSLHILRIISPRQKSAVNIWMERLHASAEYLRKSGQFGHIRDRQASLAKSTRRTAGRNQCDALLVQSLREGHERRLVEDGDQRPTDGHEVLRRWKIFRVYHENQNSI